VEGTSDEKENVIFVNVETTEEHYFALKKFMFYGVNLKSRSILPIGSLL
jgi:hypothetical protein